MSPEDSAYRDKMDLAVECLAIEMQRVGIEVPDGCGDDEIVEIATKKMVFMYNALMKTLTSDEAKVMVKVALKN